MDKTFEIAAQDYIYRTLEAYKCLSYEEVMGLPSAKTEDIVIEGKEVQLTIFKQDRISIIPDAVLVTAQIARATLGGILSFHCEKGLVFKSQQEIREATEDELRASG